MIKLPEKKYEPKHCKELKYYAKGWNSTIEDAMFLCSTYGDELAIECLSQDKELVLTRLKWKAPLPFFEGRFDCIIEIEKLYAYQLGYNDCFKDILGKEEDE